MIQKTSLPVLIEARTSLLLIGVFFASALSAQLSTEALTVDGQTRTYLKYVPVDFDASEQVPLVLCFHGGAGVAEDQLAIGDLRDTADEERFILLYPQALPDPNDGGSTNWQVVTSGDLPFTVPNPHSDIDFVAALIDEMHTLHGVDLTRVYAMGYSNGGGFVYDLTFSATAILPSGEASLAASAAGRDAGARLIFYRVERESDLTELFAASDVVLSFSK